MISLRLTLESDSYNEAQYFDAPQISGIGLEIKIIECCSPSPCFGKHSSRSWVLEKKNHHAREVGRVQDRGAVIMNGTNPNQTLSCNRGCIEYLSLSFPLPQPSYLLHELRSKLTPHLDTLPLEPPQNKSRPMALLLHPSLPKPLGRRPRLPRILAATRLSRLSMGGPRVGRTNMHVSP
jgi:hypothetical protein